MKTSGRSEKTAGIIIGVILVIYNSYSIIRSLIRGGSSRYSLILTIPFFVAGVLFLKIHLFDVYRKRNGKIKIKTLEDAQIVLSSVYRSVDIVNSTTNVKSYFSNFDYAVRVAEIFVKVENNLPFTGKKPSESLKLVKMREQFSIHDFLERTTKERAERCSDQTVNDRIAVYNSLCHEISPFLPRFCQTNTEYLSIDCRAFFEDFSQAILNKTNDRNQDYIIFGKDNVVQYAIETVLTNQSVSLSVLKQSLSITTQQSYILIDILEHAGIVRRSIDNSLSIITSIEEYQKDPYYYLTCAEKYEKEILLNSIRNLNTYQKSSIDAPAEFDHMTGYEFEEFCCKILKQNGYNNVEQTKLSGDDGLDIIAEKDDIRYGFQCKCYSSPVGNKAVQEAFTGAQMYNCDIAVVITNNTFTPQAIRTAEQTRVKLWDRTKVQEMIK